MTTRNNDEISDRMVSGYMSNLINRFYKILPIKENGEPTMIPYLESLLREMSGFKTLMPAIDDDDRYVTLLAILQHFISDDPDVATVKSDVFRAINIIKKLREKHCEKECG